MPWVRTVHFVTWGHTPCWLNKNHPKLHLVRHEDYIPQEYLPTFNSNTIELNLFRIEELSERFVLFNDDTLLLRKCTENHFFHDGLPRDEMVANAIVPRGERYQIQYTNMTNTSVINAHFSKSEVFKRIPLKILNWRYGIYNTLTLFLLPWQQGFTGFRNPHLPQTHLKSTFSEVWDSEYSLLDMTCRNKFRVQGDVSHWLMRYWNLCSGRFYPRYPLYGKYFDIGSDNSQLCNYIKRQKGLTICMNDMGLDYDFEKAKGEILGALDCILPTPSAFELS